MIIKFGSDQSDDVKEIITHPNFFKSIESLQDNIVSFCERTETSLTKIYHFTTFFQALLMLETEIYDGDLPCISSSNVDNNRCHVFSWGSAKNFENSMKVDNVKVFTKGECYTQYLINGRKQEKYVHRGNNNICVGNSNRYELDIVSLLKKKLFWSLFCYKNLSQNLSGSALTCHQKNPSQPSVLKGVLSTKINFYPHLFTDITQFADWIERTVNEKLLNSI